MMRWQWHQLDHYANHLLLASDHIDQEFVTSAKKFANFNEFSEIKKKFVKDRTKKFVKCPSVGLPRVKVTVSQQDEQVSI